MTENKVRIEDHSGNVYYPHTQADVVFMSDGSNVNQKVTQFSEQSAYYRGITVTERFYGPTNTEYYLTFVPHKDETGEIVQLKQAIRESDNATTVRSFANDNGTTLAVNCATFNITNKTLDGTTIVDGKVIKENTGFEPYNHTLGIKADNTLVSYPPSTPASQMLSDGVVNAMTAFIPLITDSAVVDNSLLNMHHMPEKHPRQAIAQMADKSLLILTCGGRGIEGEGMTALQVAEILREVGVVFAYMLDGGGSAQTVVRGTLINQSTDLAGTSERIIPSFLYVSKSPQISRDTDFLKAYEDAGNVKRQLDYLQTVGLINLTNNWQKFKLVQDSGVTKYLASGQYTSVKDIPAGQYYITGAISNQLLDLPLIGLGGWLVVIEALENNKLIDFTVNNNGRYATYRGRFNADGILATWAIQSTTLQGTGVPEGAALAPAGTFYLNTSNGTLYYKQTGIGNTGWKQVNLI